jgi:hypothetical protein
VYRNKILSLIEALVIIAGCNTNKKENNGIGSCNQDLMLLKKWIHIPAVVKSATWKFEFRILCQVE